jgi:glucose uptake protein
MYQPEEYATALLLLLASMLCWGSWANTMKLTPGYAFQLFYWDYVIGVLLGSLVWGFTLGSSSGGPLAFATSIRQADRSHILYAIAAGVVLNVANLLLVAAIDIAGLAVAFPVGIGLALVEGVLLNYAISPKGHPVLLFGGVALVVLAIILDALAYRRRERAQRFISARGIVISVACGLLMGVFYPLVTKAVAGPRSLGPYSVAFFFAAGTALCAIPLNYRFMKRSLTGSPPVYMSAYFRAKPAWHWWGVIGGLVWCTGTVFNFVASHAQIVGPAVSYAIGQGATMVSAVWGVFVWKEFASAPQAARRLIPAMFLFFLVGLGSIAIAPLVPSGQNRSSMKKPIVVVGSINLDLVAGADRIPQIGETIIGDSFRTFCGGKGANQAVAAARLGHPVAMVGSVGNDFGAQLRNGLNDAGVDTTYVNTVEGPSGVALIATGRRGENSIVVVPGANHHLTPRVLERAAPVLSRAAFLLAQLEIPFDTVDYLAQFAERNHIPFMLDPAPARELSLALLRRVSWMTPNETEARELLRAYISDGGHDSHAVADRLLARGINNVVLKLGSQGCLVAEGNLAKEHVPAFPVKAVDTTAAGDAFNAGFAVGLLRGYTTVRSAIFASGVAAISVTQPGAQPSMPRGDEVDGFLEQHSVAVTNPAPSFTLRFGAA